MNRLDSLKTLYEVLKKDSDRIVLLFGACRLSGIAGQAEALKRIEQLDLKFDAVYGSQIGSVFAAMHAYGVSYKDILYYILKELSPQEIFDYRVKDFIKNTILLQPMRLDGICYGDRINQSMGRLFQSVSDKKKLPLYIFSEYFRMNQLKLFTVPDEIPLLTALRASMAITALYPPAEYNGELYVDSGLFGGLPLYHIQKNEQKISGRRKIKTSIIAFHEAFKAHQPELNIGQRLVYSFHEKIRYHSSKIEIERCNDKTSKILLISFHGTGEKPENFASLSYSEKIRTFIRFSNDIDNQIDFYFRRLHLGKKKKWKNEYYPLTRS